MQCFLDRVCIENPSKIAPTTIPKHWEARRDERKGAYLKHVYLLVCLFVGVGDSVYI